MEKAIVDIKTGKILNCEKGSFEYNHELAHLKFQEEFSFLVFIQEQVLFWTIVSIVLTFFINIFKWIDLVGILTMISLYIFEEYYCNYKAKFVIPNNSHKDLNSII